MQEQWQLSNKEISELLHIKPSTYHNWEQNERVPLGAKPFGLKTQMVITFLAIYRSLGAMFNNQEDQLIWLKSEHKYFKKSPFDFAKDSAGNLFALRSYLDYKRGRGA